MTRTEFLTELALIRDRFNWKLSPETGHGRSLRVRQNIRAIPKEAPGIVLDPLGAVCYINYRMTIDPADWSRAGEMLGLAAPGELAAAANDQTWAGTGTRREPIEYLQHLRRRLESAVGLATIDGPGRASSTQVRRFA